MIKAVSYFGLGYVGLTSAVCLAYRGFKVIGFDIDYSKVEIINAGKPTFYEPNVEELLKVGLNKGLFHCTSDPIEAVQNSNVTFVTVGSPSNPDGSINLDQVKSAARQIGEALKIKSGYHLVVVRSTVVPGSTENIVKPLIEKYSGKGCGGEFGLCFNPEFLREGSAVEDTFNSDRIVIGEFDKQSGDILEKLYTEFYAGKMPPTIRTSLPNAELIKYVNNAFLAMKVSFINMIANLCQKLPGADVEIVAKGIGLDKRIGPLFLKAGAGWGGSCWPKDLKALLDFSIKNNVELQLVESTLKVNEAQPYKLIDLAKELIGELNGKRVAVLGLAFKPNTDDMRYAVSIKIINKLLEEGAKVVAYDPKAIHIARKIFGDVIEYASSIKECLKDSECALIITEWNEFRKLTPEDFIKLMKIPAVVDGRRIYDPEVYSPKLRFAAIGLGERKYRNPALAANAIIEEGDKILLVKRSIEPYKGFWSLPGGFIEYNETIEASLIREVEEETGLKIEPLKVVGVYSNPLRSPVKHVITICYKCDIIGGKLKPSNENGEVKFFSILDLPEQFAFDHLKIIKDYITASCYKRAKD